MMRFTYPSCILLSPDQKATTPNMNALYIITIAISLFSFAISVLTYFRNSDEKQLRREQATRMRVLAGRSVVYWDQLLTIRAAQIKKFPVDDYMFPSMRANARQVADALDAVVGVGLLNNILDEAPYSLQRYTAFYQSLIWLASIPEGEQRPLEDYLKSHLLFGMMRLLDSCIKFKPMLLPEEVRQSIESQIVNDLPLSRTYLSNSECK